MYKNLRKWNKATELVMKHLNSDDTLDRIVASDIHAIASSGQNKETMTRELRKYLYENNPLRGTVGLYASLLLQALDYTYADEIARILWDHYNPDESENSDVI